MTTLLVASGGGHLKQLISLLPRMDIDDDVVWATPDSGLSRDHLKSSKWRRIPYVPARDWRTSLKLLPTAREILKETGATRIISTGAAPAPPFFLVGAAQGLELHFIETATRSQGPSLSGSLVSKLPRVHLYTQYPSLETRRWRFAGSIFDPFTAEAASPEPPPGQAPEQASEQPSGGPADDRQPQRIVVSLGTEQFGFRRAIEALLEVLPRGADVLWQTGATDTTGLPIEAHESVPSQALKQAIKESDLFICHAGTGSALTAFEMGKSPLLLPREAAFGEHVDDHQLLTANELSRRGLAVATRVRRLRSEHLIQASQTRVTSDREVRPFALSHR